MPLDPGEVSVVDGEPAVTLSGLRKTFGSGPRAVRAVDGVDLQIADGEFLSLLGPAGSGGTTILRLIAGFERPTAGRVLLAGQDVTALPPFRRDVNTVFRDCALFPHLSVFENVAYGLRVKGVPAAETAERVERSLGTVRLDGAGERRPGELSAGGRLRVALARALVNRPGVLLLDEPLGALDLASRVQLQAELQAIQRQVGITFVLVTHDQGGALTMSDRVAVVQAGRIEQVGAPTTVYERPATPFVAGFVGASNLIGPDVAAELVGQKATFSVRPEKIRLVAGDHEPDLGEVVADGVIREIAYAGSSSRIVVGLRAGPEITVLRQNGPDQDGVPVPRPGSPVRLAWGRRHAVRLPVQESPTGERVD